MKHVDVAIIGGSLAGAACARELTAQGIDAVAFERDRFPREKVCGGFLSPGAVDLLDQLGALDAVRAAGARTVRSSRVRMGDVEALVALPRPGLGISRQALDSLVADHPAVERGFVREVRRSGDSFEILLNDWQVSASIVVDAAGKLSRFSRRRPAPQFGIQFYDDDSRADVLDFWFFEDGYGGAVSVEGGRSSSCFLIEKDALGRYVRNPGKAAPSPDTGDQRSPLRDWLHRPGKDPVLVTGPLSYDRCTSDYLSIGDAAGMVDPFCGEGMRHALDTGISAARIIAHGLRRRETYGRIKARYDHESHLRWSGKRRLGRFFRFMLQYPRLSAAGFRLNPEYWLRKLWD